MKCLVKGIVLEGTPTEFVEFFDSKRRIDNVMEQAPTKVVTKLVVNGKRANLPWTVIEDRKVWDVYKQYPRGKKRSKAVQKLSKQLGRSRQSIYSRWNDKVKKVEKWE